VYEPHGLLPFLVESTSDSHFEAARVPVYVNVVSATCGKRFVGSKTLVNALVGVPYSSVSIFEMVSWTPESYQTTVVSPGE
jgi:hypothetical protein